jgi:Cellulase (glycosyl hydrolase family 5)
MNNGLPATRQKWERHWQSALSEADFLWLLETARCNSIRLPIGHFTLGPEFCVGTVFDGDAAQVYVNAWSAVKKLIQDCHTRGIGVLLDFHALPGGANKDAHSGTNSGKAELWTSKHNLSVAKECINFVVREVVNHQMTNVIGIELCNEPSRAASAAVFKWYDEVLPMISAIDPTLPVYIGDCWDLSAGINYAMKKNSSKMLSNPVIIDTHKYYTFGANDHSQTPQQIIERVNSSLGDVVKNQGHICNQKTALEVYIGEYSCTLDSKTWDRVNSADRPALTQAFGRAQTEKWQKVTCGSAFWTLKMNWMDGGDWGFKKQVNTGAITAPRNLTFSFEDVQTRTQKANSERDQLRTTVVSQHVDYWGKKRAPNDNFESGWDLGFTDAMYFFCARVNSITIPGNANSHHQAVAGGDRIGALELWILKRMVESGRLNSSLAWEWEHGYRRAVKDFEKVAVYT